MCTHTYKLVFNICCKNYVLIISIFSDISPSWCSPFIPEDLGSHLSLFTFNPKNFFRHKLTCGSAEHHSLKLYLPKKVCISLSFTKNTFNGYASLCFLFFVFYFQYFKDVNQLSSQLLLFPEE